MPLLVGFDLACKLQMSLRVLRGLWRIHEDLSSWGGGVLWSIQLQGGGNGARFLYPKKSS